MNQSLKQPKDNYWSGSNFLFYIKTQSNPIQTKVIYTYIFISFYIFIKLSHALYLFVENLFDWRSFLLSIWLKVHNYSY